MLRLFTECSDNDLIRRVQLSGDMCAQRVVIVSTAGAADCDSPSSRAISRQLHPGSRFTPAVAAFSLADVRTVREGAAFTNAIGVNTFSLTKTLLQTSEHIRVWVMSTRVNVALIPVQWYQLDHYRHQGLRACCSIRRVCIPWSFHQNWVLHWQRNLSWQTTLLISVFVTSFHGIYVNNSSHFFLKQGCMSLFSFCMCCIHKVSVRPRFIQQIMPYLGCRNPDRQIVRPAIHFVLWCLISMNRQYGTSIIAPFWCQNFELASRFLEN
jgi:hypothetical protein